MKYRTHTCNDLVIDQVGEDVILSGWVHRRRDHGGLIFIDLRDRYGLTQIVFDPEITKEAWEKAEKVRSEYVIRIEGKVRKRLEGAENKNLNTGKIEIEVSGMEVLNTSQTPPFEIDQDKEVNEELRLQYRYLDLRRERMKKNIIMRHEIAQFMRKYLSEQSFVEIETPILIKGTPEGAREFLVPSRIYPGKFYVLPQSPQQLKQLLMVAGFDRYFQIARCFRDEDSRGDRQPEFTQLDLEMSFVNGEDVMDLIEAMMLKLTRELYPQKKIWKDPMPRLTWKEAMETYGSDRPDLRFDMPLTDVCEEVKGCEFQVFNQSIEKGGVVKALKVPGAAAFSRKNIDDLTEVAKTYGAKGLAYILFTEEGPKAPILKFLSDDIVKKIQDKTGAEKGDGVFFGADDFDTACESLGAVRSVLGDKLGLKDKDLLAYCWVYDFPLYHRKKDTGELTCSHHPFTHPKHEHLDLLDTDPEKVIGDQYDIVLNGNEIGGGTIRIHSPDLQRKIFKILGLADDDVERRFGHMMNAFSYGAPPHGGLALGFDRVVMVLQDEHNIREVMAYPKDQKMKDLMTGAPDIVPDEQIKEANIQILEEQQ